MNLILLIEDSIISLTLKIGFFGYWMVRDGNGSVFHCRRDHEDKTEIFVTERIFYIILREIGDMIVFHDVNIKNSDEKGSERRKIMYYNFISYVDNPCCDDDMPY